MDLKTFIANTLTQIVEGVKEASDLIGKGDSADGCINPQGANSINNQIVSFDVALTVEETQGSTQGNASETGGKIRIAQIFGFHHKRGSTTAEEIHGLSQSVCRIKIDVPIRLPATPDVKKAQIEAERKKQEQETAATLMKNLRSR
jgi:hypothetical protein